MPKMKDSIPKMDEVGAITKDLDEFYVGLQTEEKSLAICMPVHVHYLEKEKHQQHYTLEMY